MGEELIFQCSLCWGRILLSNFECWILSPVGLTSLGPTLCAFFYLGALTYVRSSAPACCGHRAHFKSRFPCPALMSHLMPWPKFQFPLHSFTWGFPFLWSSSMYLRIFHFCCCYILFVIFMYWNWRRISHICSGYHSNQKYSVNDLFVFCIPNKKIKGQCQLPSGNLVKQN